MGASTRPGELVDSSGLAGDAVAMRERMREDGYVLVRDLLDRQRVLDVRRDVARTLEAQGWLRAGSDPMDAVPSEPVRLGPYRRDGARDADEDAPRGWWATYRALQSLESFHRFAHDPDLLAMLGVLVGEQVVVHPRKIIRVSFPGEATTHAHQDYTNIQGTADCFTVWIPLGDYERDAGVLQLLPGSGATGIAQVAPDRSSGRGIASVVDAVGSDWATTDFRAGDALVFHSLIVHAATPNRSERLRLSVDYRYQPASEPITVESLRPHFFPRVPDWPQLTPGWTTTRWIDAPPDLARSTFVYPEDVETWHDRIEPPRSRFRDLTSP